MDARRARRLAASMALLLLLGGCAPAVAPRPAEQSVIDSAGRRHLGMWPFRWDSPWNLPLSTARSTVPAQLIADGADLDLENISVDPAFPVRTLDADGRTYSVHSDPELAADGSWNNCATFLTTERSGRTIVQGQPLRLSPGGDPSVDYDFGESTLDGDGIRGCHGGSHLSGIGGSIRVGELTSPYPIRHALKINLPCPTGCSQADGGFRWPATTSDTGYDDPANSNFYGGSNPEVRMGSLLVLPPEVDLAGLPPDAQKIGRAMRDYGVYVVDTSTTLDRVQWGIQRGAEQEFPNHESPALLDLVEKLHVVTNNGPATPGGGPLGSPRMADCAPAFTDGTGAAPPSCAGR